MKVMDIEYDSVSNLKKLVHLVCELPLALWILVLNFKHRGNITKKKFEKEFQVELNVIWVKILL